MRAVKSPEQTWIFSEGESESLTERRDGDAKALAADVAIMYKILHIVFALLTHRRNSVIVDTEQTYAYKM